MAEIKYTKQEKKEIYEALDLVLDDIRRLFDAANIEEVRVKLPMQFYDYCAGLKVTSQYIKIVTYYVDTDATLVLEKKVGNRRIKRNPAIDEVLPIIRNYEEIRKDIELEIEHITVLNKTEREKTIQAVANIRKNYTKDATIELDLGPSQNIHEIEVVEEAGQKIGTINFGNRLIKIITDGDIVLVKRAKGKQTKSKQR